MSKKVDILYYSATGNTETVIAEIVEALCKNEIEVRKQVPLRAV